MVIRLTTLPRVNNDAPVRFVTDAEAEFALSFISGFGSGTDAAVALTPRCRPFFHHSFCGMNGLLLAPVFINSADFRCC